MVVQVRPIRHSHGELKDKNVANEFSSYIQYRKTYSTFPRGIERFDILHIDLLGDMGKTYSTFPRGIESELFRVDGKIKATRKTYSTFPRGIERPHKYTIISFYIFQVRPIRHSHGELKVSKIVEQFSYVFAL